MAIRESSTNTASLTAAHGPGEGTRPIDIVVPFYRNPPLVASLFDSLRDCREELVALGCRVVAINDSPGDEPLERALSGAAEKLPGLTIDLIRNERNLGFVRSVNLALARAVSAGHDALLLNSDTRPFPGAVRELAEVAYLDPMIGFVSPRSNNATICSLPQAAQYRHLPPEQAHDAFCVLKPHLPRHQYVPTAVGFCLFIKREILAEFGLFDEVYTPGYNEENDLIMRANRCGYRAALANHAYVYHIGEASFSLADVGPSEHERTHSALLISRYPEYTASVGRYLSSSTYEAERLLTALVPYRDGRRDVVFDFSNVGTYYCGTFELATRWLAEALNQWRDRFHIHVAVSEEAKKFHRLDELAGLLFVPVETDNTFAAAFRVGQPFDYPAMRRMSRLAAVNVYSMLDPISYDCQHLNTDELGALWSLVMGLSDGVVYISEFVKREFNLRFPKGPDLLELVAYPSLDARDYPAPPAASQPGSYYLILGNSFAHKRLEPTVRALAGALPGEKFVVIGMAGAFGSNVICHSSGHLSEQEIDNLYAGARAMIYPSLYEGFGIPVVKALAFRRPVLARSIPVIEELRQRLPDEPNLHLYSSTEELTQLLQTAPPAWEGEGAAAGASSRDAVCAIGRMIDQALAAGAPRDRLAQRIETLRRWHGSAETAVAPAASAMEADLRRQIGELRESWSWRITAPLRTVAGWCLRLRR
jgi:GT2 family glycosyltransferase